MCCVACNQESHREEERSGEKRTEENRGKMERSGDRKHGKTSYSTGQTTLYSSGRMGIWWCDRRRQDAKIAGKVLQK
jgi:hypothetical protein